MIEWNDGFSVHYSQIDEQHKMLISIMQRLGELLANQEFDLLSVSGVVSELDDYVRIHFAFEEQLMVQYGYEDQAAHIAQHDALREKLEEINIFDVEDVGKFLNETLMYLVNWLMKHIMQTDQKLGLFLSVKV